MNTPFTYYDETEKVPYPPYRCRATAQERPGHTHHCRRHVDHAESKHKCICEKTWDRVGEGDEHDW